MEKEKENKISCTDDDEYRICSYICDKFFVGKYNKNHLKSGTLNFNFHKSKR